ncbi:MAG TPA: GtrA family protein [Candidatus Sulfotelmatobacter sp.]|nr:GtrA family protein [Candidatus Sulfotelmatobacter sp.]
MKTTGRLASPVPAAPRPAPGTGAEGLGVDLAAGAGCVGIAIPILHRVVGSAGVLPLAGPRGPAAFLLVGVVAVGLGFVAAHREPLAGYAGIRQFLRYGCTGLLNASIDFGTLNLLVAITGVYSGIGLVPLNVVAFMAASLNSFVWNRLWTFRRRGRGRLLRELAAFYMVAIGGAAVSSGILWAIATLVPRPAGLRPIAWVNGAKLAAGGSAILWNFLWYRYWVFRHLPVKAGRPGNPSGGRASRASQDRPYPAETPGG